MRWLTIARKDVADARRSRQLYYLTGLFALIGIAVGYVVGSNQVMSPETLGILLLNAFAFLAPVAALTISQGDIVGKRTTGELSVLLSLPFSRRSIVFGSFIGRTAVLTASIVPTFVLGALLMVVQGSSIDMRSLVIAFLVGWMLAIVFAAIALGLSALTRSTTVAAAGSFGVFLLFVLQVWSLIPTGVRFLLGGFSLPTGPPPEWAAVFVQLSPFAALRNLTHPAFPALLDTFQLAPGGVQDPVPWFQEPRFAAVVLCLWTVLPLLVGYIRFQRTDL